MRGGGAGGSRKPAAKLLTVDGVHMAFPGNCMMAWGVLKALGVPDSLKGEIEAAWRKMPEAYEVSFKLTAEEYDALKKRIGGENPSAYARRKVME